MSEPFPSIAPAPRERVLRPTHTRHVTLLDLLDRLLGGGVVIRGHITLAAADIDLVELDLGILVAATDKVMDS
jgi:hypothetical protein